MSLEYVYDRNPCLPCIVILYVITLPYYLSQVSLLLRPWWMGSKTVTSLLELGLLTKTYLEDWTSLVMQEFIELLAPRCLLERRGFEVWKLQIKTKFKLSPLVQTNLTNLTIVLYDMFCTKHEVSIKTLPRACTCCCCWAFFICPLPQP